MENQPILDPATATQPITESPGFTQKKTNIVIPTLLSLLVSGVVFGLGGYYLGKQSSQPQNYVNNEQNQAITTTNPQVNNLIPRSTASPTPDQTANWQTYTNTTYGFSFRHPSTLVNRGSVSGPMTGKKIALESFADPATMVEGTDAPFNGFSLYIVTEMMAKDFETFITNEQKAMNIAEYSMMQNVKPTQFANGVAFINSNSGYYYLPFPDQKRVAVFGYVEQNSSFRPTFDQVLSTFKFTN